MDKQTIIREIQRTAAENGGAPLGRLRLEKEAGIKEHQWKKYWARLSDAHREAGFEPNAWIGPIDETMLVTLLVALTRDLGHFPTHAELLVKCTAEKSWPSQSVFINRLGSKAAMVDRVAAYCQESPGFDDVLAHCASVTKPPDHEVRGGGSEAQEDGFVYMLKSGRFYKIGKSNHAGRRERELAVQLPERAEVVHTIKTDDPSGIERYWHQRFEGKRKNGEWFDLGREEISAFRRRKFM